MSADDWSECPFCVKPIKQEIKELEQKLENAYTMMTAADYDVLKASVKEEIDNLKTSIEEKALLRIDLWHDYTFDEDGDLTIYLTASCSHCGRQWNKDGVTVEPKLEERYYG